MSISIMRLARAKRRVLREYRCSKSWRALAREKYPAIKHGTLQRFATDATYCPADEDILISLRLKKPHDPMAALPRYFQKTEAALLWFNHQKQIIKDEAKRTRTSLKGKS